MPWKLDGHSTDNNLVEYNIQTSRLKTVHFVQGGNPGGLPVVLLHDNLASSRWWEAAQEQLAYRYRSIAPDFRGFGQTEYQPVNSLSVLAEDLHDLVTGLQLPPFFVVGWGMGGGVALEYALHHPEQLVGMCLVNSIGPKGHRSTERNEQLDELTRALQNNNQNEIATYLRRHYFRNGNFPVGETIEGREPGEGPLANPQAFSYILGGSMQARNFSYTEQEGIFHAMRNWDVHKAIGKFTFPVFMVLSGDDRIIRADEVRDLRAALSTGQHIFDEVILPGVGHSPMVERSDMFMQALSGYLGRLNFQHVVNPGTTRTAFQMIEADQQSNQKGYGAHNQVSDIAYDNEGSQTQK